MMNFSNPVVWLTQTIVALTLMPAATRRFDLRQKWSIFCGGKYFVGVARLLADRG
jgi:hypothetical protein